MKICLVQCHSKHDIQLNLEYAKKTLERAATQSCDLVVFPELFLTGYVATEKTKTIAIKSDSNELKDLQFICESNNIACVIGFPRKDKTNIFNSA